MDVAQVRTFGKWYKIKVLSIFHIFWFYTQYAQKIASKNGKNADKRYVEHSGTYSLYLG